MLDNYSQWESKMVREDRWLNKRPVCDYCDEHIQDEHFYSINGECICPECIENHFRKWTEDYIV